MFAMLNTPIAVFLFPVKYNHFSVIDKGFFGEEKQQDHFLSRQITMWRNFHIEKNKAPKQNKIKKNPNPQCFHFYNLKDNIQLQLF